MIVGVFTKFGALFVTIPEPIIGGVFMVMFGELNAQAMVNLFLQFASLKVFELIKNLSY